MRKTRAPHAPKPYSTDNVEVREALNRMGKTEIESLLSMSLRQMTKFESRMRRLYLNRMSASRSRAAMFQRHRDNEERVVALQGEVAMVRAELGKVKAELGKVKAELGEVKMEFGEVKAELEETKTDCENAATSPFVLEMLRDTDEMF